MLEGGNLSQGNFESFPVEDDQLFLVVRYAERTPVRTTLADRAEYVRIFPLKGEQISAQRQARLRAPPSVTR